MVVRVFVFDAAVIPGSFGRRHDVPSRTLFP